MGYWCGLCGFERGLRDAETPAVVPMQLHLDFEGISEQSGKQIHGLKIAGFGRRQRKHAAVLDQEKVVLLQIEAKAIHR